jgi:formiminotetrahydrofolate cyclodeaminase
MALGAVSPVTTTALIRTCDMPPAAQPPGAGTAAAETVLIAANLCAGLALSAPDSQDARGAAVQAAHLRSRAAGALDETVVAHAAARERLALPPGTGSGRDARLAAALSASADSLLAIATVAADTAALAAAVARELPAAARSDALGAAELAAGAAAVAAALVEVNLGLGRDDPRRATATRLRGDARAGADCARRALLG